MTYYDYVNNQVQAGLWEQTQFMFGRNATALDFYYRIYTLVQKYYPERKKGYAVQFVHNEEVMRSIGGGVFARSETPGYIRAIHRKKSGHDYGKTFQR